MDFKVIPWWAVAYKPFLAVRKWWKGLKRSTVVIFSTAMTVVVVFGGLITITTMVAKDLKAAMAFDAAKAKLVKEEADLAWQNKGCPVYTSNCGSYKAPYVCQKRAPWSSPFYVGEEYVVPKLTCGG